jgi:hypothetical protein
MLYFATKPDPVFAMIVDTALHHGQVVAADPERWGCCAHIRRFFPCRTGTWVLRDLRAAHRKPSAYQMSDFHWILIHTFLREFCERYNDRQDGANHRSSVTAPLGDYRIGQIAFHALVGRFFWDVESLPWIADTVRPPACPVRGITDRREKIKAGHPPEFGDLRLTPVRWPQWRPAFPTIPAGTEVPRYPPDAADADRLLDPIFLHKTLPARSGSGAQRPHAPRFPDLAGRRLR